MNEKQGEFGVARTAPVQKMQPPKVLHVTNSSACEVVLQIGIFFDGTGNSIDLDKKDRAHSNVARLFEVYPDHSEQATFSTYVPGLGVPFALIGEYEASILGSAFASGGESRIIYGLLRVLNAVHNTLFGIDLFDVNLTRAICSANPSKAEIKLLRRIGLDRSLVNDDSGSRRVRYLSLCIEAIATKMRSGRVPKICECCIDVFGFSRGASEARVFCHWLNQLLNNSKLAGVPCRFRFLGLMDTVASVGLWERVKSNALQTTGGHAKWATTEAMRILPAVENCVHLIAMHELRKNFPLDTVLVDHKLPPNCIELAYPGSHSDIGGGYRPGELGVSAHDALKLSQIPLNHMYDCAVAAGVPLSKELLGTVSDTEAFTVDRTLLAAFNQFIDASTEAPRSLSDWALPYLVWRWQARKVYDKTGQVVKSNVEDRQYLLMANQQFCWADEQIKNYLSFSPTMRQKLPYDRDRAQITLSDLEPEAAELRARVAGQLPIHPVLAQFFDNFVHDSVAGFRKQFVEPTGHWRYRRVFGGSANSYTG